MKKAFFLLTLIIGSSAMALDNPYSTGGMQYGSQDFYQDQPMQNPQVNDFYNTQSNAAINGGNTYQNPNTAVANPYNQSSPAGQPFALNSNSDTTTLNNSTSFSGSEPSSSSDNSLPNSPWSKVENWFQRKKSNPNQPKLDLAEQRIAAGKARIEAIKAEEKLNEHLTKCKAKTTQLEETVQRYNERANILENQVKLQDNNNNQASAE